MSDRMRRVKLALAFAGLVLSGIAVATQDRRVTWAAIAFLAAALAVRIIDRGRPT